MTLPRTLSAAAAVLATLVLVPAAAAAASFDKPVFVTQDRAYQAAEPSIRVDASDPTQRIWIAAPSGIGVDTRSLPASTESGDLFWYSDDDGRTWHYVTGPAGIGSPTLLGGGDSDVATGYGADVYATGLTLVNVTLAASCDRGETFATNPLSAAGSVDDRQWIDTYEDAPRPRGAPELVLTYGNFGAQRILFHQVTSPACASPLGPVPLDVTMPGTCTVPLFGDPTCYQWPGNIAVDETTGDAYVTYNTQGDPESGDHDDVVVSRIVKGASQLGSAVFASTLAAQDRPDTFDSFTVAAVDRAGNVYVVWSERHHAVQATTTMLAVSTDHGATWRGPFQVNHDPRTTTYPWIVAGDAGRIDIVYYGTKEKGPSPEELSDKAKWRVYMAQSLNALDKKPTFKEGDATGDIHQGSICTSGTGCASGTRDLLDFFQVDVDAQGYANIAYTDNLNTPPEGADAHQEWIAFVQQKGGPRLYGAP